MIIERLKGAVCDDAGGNEVTSAEYVRKSGG